MTSIVSFFKVPVAVSNADTRYEILDLLLPQPFESDEWLCRMTQWIIQFRSVIHNQIDIDATLAHFFLRQPFSCFNMIWVRPSPEPDKRRIALKGMEFLHIGDETFPLSSTEWDSQYLCMKVSLSLAKIYIKG